jgi:hypothetical protein
MARIRSIHPGFLTDEEVMGLTMEEPIALIALIGLWSEADDHGLFEWKALTLKARILPGANVNFRDLLIILMERQFIKMVVINDREYGMIRNFMVYQRPRRPSYIHPVTPEVLQYVGEGRKKAPQDDTPTDNDGTTDALYRPTPDNVSTELADGGKDVGKREGEKEDSRRKAPRRISYPPLFETFWLAYPKDDGMSKAEALQPWFKLSAEDQEKAIAAIPAFKEWIKTQNAEYRTLHACRYLSKRRFDGFVEKAAAMEAASQQHSTQVYVQYGTDAGDAWERHYRTVLKKPPPRDSKGGWRFPSEYPEQHSSAA